MAWFDFRPRTTPTQLAQMVRCEQQMLFKRKFGDRQTAASAAAIRKGVKGHQQMEKQGAGFLTQGQSRRQCFIATAVYGGDAYQTIMLRKYRDSYLLSNRAGKILIEVYYTLSPPIAALLNSLPFLKPLVRLALWPIILLVKKCLS